MNDGALLYVDIIDDTGPLAALVYKGFNYLFGRSQLALQIAGLLLFYFQIFYINFLALKHKMYNENNYLSALIYGVLGLTSFNLVTLSPVMMSLTFFLLSLNNLLNHVETRSKTDNNLINIGIYTGLSIMFYLPFVWMIPFHILTLLFFTNTLKRRYLLMIYGLLVPMSIIWLYYLWQGEATAFYTMYLYSIFSFSSQTVLSINSLFILFGFTIGLYLLSSFKILAGFGFNIFQVRIQKTMFFASIVILSIWLLYSNKSGEEVVMFLPWVAFFLSHFFLTIRHRLKRELSFMIYMISIVIIYSAFTFNWGKIGDLSSVLVDVQENEAAPVFAENKILVLGPHIQPYYFGKVATPYFNWEISKRELQELNYYDNLEEINRKIRSDMPEYIIDQVDLAPKIFEKIPLLGKEFYLLETGIYKRKTMSN